MSNHETNIMLNNLGSKRSLVMKSVNGMKKESEEVCMLILTYFYSLLAIAYLIIKKIQFPIEVVLIFL